MKLDADFLAVLAIPFAVALAAVPVAIAHAHPHDEQCDMEWSMRDDRVVLTPVNKMSWGCIRALGYLDGRGEDVSAGNVDWAVRKCLIE